MSANPRIPASLNEGSSTRPILEVKSAPSKSLNANGPSTTYTPSTSVTLAPIQGTIRIEQSDEPGPIYSLLEAAIWPFFIVILLLWFRKQVRSILSAIAENLEKGASLEGWGIKIGSVPQTPAQQVHKLEQEVNEVAQAENIQAQAAGPNRAQLTTLYLAAGDLALREIQAEFRVPVSRNMSTSGEEFDGIFAVGQIAYLVEVKLVRNEKTHAIAQRTINRFADAISRTGWKNAKGLLAVVYDAPVNLEAERQTLQVATNFVSPTIEIRVFRLRDLAEKYRVALPER